jgi:hypothetical protein
MTSRKKKKLNQEACNVFSIYEYLNINFLDRMYSTQEFGIEQKKVNLLDILWREMVEIGNICILLPPEPFTSTKTN